MICIVRISGEVNVGGKIKETLNRLRLRRKYSCVLINPTKENMGMLKKLRDYVAYGEINKETLAKLIEKRAQPIDKKKKIDSSKISEEIVKEDYAKMGIKPFFRLHPPRGGIKSKIHFPKGILGDNKEKINELVGRML